jgi:hypothetical protein
MRTMVWGVFAALALAGPALAATTLGGGQYVVRDAYGSQLESMSDVTNLPDVFKEVNYLPVIGVNDYALSRGLGGDRYARAGSAAGIQTPDLFHQAQGSGRWINTAVASGTGLADITALFRGTVSFFDALSLADRRNFVCGGTGTCANYPDTDFDFSLSSRATFGFSVEDSVTLDKYFLLASFAIRREVTRIDDRFGNFERAAEDSSEGSWMSYLAPGGSGFQQIGSGAINTSIQRAGPASLLNGLFDIAMPVPFVAGRSYTFDLLVTCTSEAAGLEAYLTSGQPGLASCNATNSGYLTGFENFRDAGGNAIAPFGLIARDGTNLALPSPLAPGGGPQPIPEPDSWAMLIAGFGLTGAVLRRRRALAAG